MNERDCKGFGHVLITHSHLAGVFGVVKLRRRLGKKRGNLGPVLQGTYTTAAAEPRHMNHMPS